MNEYRRNKVNRWLAEHSRIARDLQERLKKSGWTLDNMRAEKERREKHVRENLEKQPSLFPENEEKNSAQLVLI